MSNFVLMLTRDDVTVADAADLLEQALATGVIHIGFKDVGLSAPEMHALVDRIKAAGRRAHLEVVSLTEDDERRSIEIGMELGVDYLLGGTRWRLGAGLLRGSGIRYFPYAGAVSSHPGVLGGDPDQILNDIAEMATAVDGVNLLAYRHHALPGDELVETISSKSAIPVLVAGSIDSTERIDIVRHTGAWGFTVGAAALDAKFVAGQGLAAQLAAILDAAGPQKSD